MSPEEYISSRVDDQIDYYNNESKKSQKKYKNLTAIQIVCGALVPAVSGFSDEIWCSEWILALLGLFVTISTSFVSLNKYQEKWINYRTTCETLIHFKNLFVTKSTPYKDDNRFDKFVNDIESVISKENSDWGVYIRKDTKSD